MYSEKARAGMEKAANQCRLALEKFGPDAEVQIRASFVLGVLEALLKVDDVDNT
jgi:hypothetical protein